MIPDIEPNGLKHQSIHSPYYLANLYRAKYDVRFCTYSGKQGSSQFTHKGKQVMIELTPNKQGTSIMMLPM